MDSNRDIKMAVDEGELRFMECKTDLTEQFCC